MDVSVLPPPPNPRKRGLRRFIYRKFSAPLCGGRRSTDPAPYQHAVHEPGVLSCSVLRNQSAPVGSKPHTLPRLESGSGIHD